MLSTPPLVMAIRSAPGDQMPVFVSPRKVMEGRSAVPRAKACDVFAGNTTPVSVTRIWSTPPSEKRMSWKPTRYHPELDSEFHVSAGCDWCHR